MRDLTRPAGPDTHTAAGALPGSGALSGDGALPGDGVFPREGTLPRDGERPVADDRADTGRLTALARELLDRVAQDGALTAQAQQLPGPQLRRRLARCRAANAAALREIVDEHGWPTAALVGAEASTAALMILLHADDLPLQLTGRDLITDAVERGQCSPIHAAYAADHCAVELGRPQRYGTRYSPLGRPFPVADPDGVDERRVSIGLRTMAAEQQALAEIRLRHLNRASA